MQISIKGIDALKTYEGFRAKAYLDGGGVWTVGYGSTKVDGIPVVAGKVVTPEKAEMQLKQDLGWAQAAVNKLVKVPITQDQFDALVSFVYNIGETAFTRSTLLKLLNARQYAQAADEFPKWKKINGVDSQGLLNRRMAERAQFMGK